MKVEEWLDGLIYNSNKTSLNKIINNEEVKIIDIKGWKEIVNNFDNEATAASFHDEVVIFVLEAIRDKVEKEKEIRKNWDKLHKFINTNKSII